ncbi:MAG: hypothetical protein K2V38_04020 [Gemmataceae bacterium]|nr:hypothetical protein [Gemmataceae bacterium]
MPTRFALAVAFLMLGTAESGQPDAKKVEELVTLRRQGKLAEAIADLDKTVPLSPRD